MRLTDQGIYNIPGVRASGIKPFARTLKTQGSHPCGGFARTRIASQQFFGCDKRISATGLHCARRQALLAAEPDVTSLALPIAA
jgi:hypothetical protein